MLKIVLAGSAALLLSSAAYAHPHLVVTPGTGPEGQVIANGQNHPAFVNGDSCADDDWPDNAWYGLETAHHGPDAGDPGRDDSCYTTTGNVAPGEDVENPVIR